MKKGYIIYFLLLDGAIIYIGHSKNIKSRMSEHNRTKVFNCFMWIYCDSKESALHYEKRWQMKFKPKHNVNGTIEKKQYVKVKRLQDIEPIIEKISKKRYRVNVSLDEKEYLAYK